MAIIDISAKLTDAKPILKIGENPEDQYVIDDRKNTILEVQQMFENAIGDNDISSAGKAIEIILGKEAVEDIKKKWPEALESISSLKVLYIGISAGIQGISYEEAEARFLDETKV